MEMNVHLPADVERKRGAIHATATFHFENRRRLGRLADGVKKLYWQWIYLAPLGFCFGIAHATTDSAEQNWAQWRGPLANGVAPQANPPVTWSETNNIRWKVKIPGGENSTPIIWNDRLFVQTAIPPGRKGGTIVEEKVNSTPVPAANGSEPSRIFSCAATSILGIFIASRKNEKEQSARICIDGRNR